MKLLQNILVTIDFSESSEYVLEKSIRLAKKFNSQITLMHVISDHHMSSKLDKFLDDTVKAQLDKIASEIEEADVDLKDIIIEHGVPFEKIIEEVQINDYNVIVAGSLAKPESETFKLGTTVEKLIRKNPIPIWVVKPEPLRKVKKILCPVDFSDASHRALNNAITLAQSFKAELFIQHIYPPVSYSPMWRDMDYEEEKKNLRVIQEAEFNEFLEPFDMKNISYKKVTAEGVDYQEILKFISENNIDLLLMGTTGKTGLSRILMGSTTTKVTRELPCSFITTKAKDITDDFFESYLKSLQAIIKSAKQSQQIEDYEKAIEKYTIALKQYPDNIPVLMGLIESYQAIGNKHKVDYYRKYGHEVIEKTWGHKYLKIIKL
ncbi:universal stress protein [Carboxylicivirga sp. RSCT41]|uniref:universal stress protein n=1 Tax=Carboxylicivirga agarovorans TaxID=3417570 RepID=UPI003D33207B